MKPFKLHDIWRRRIFQRGKMHRLPLEAKRASFQHFGIGTVVGLAPKRPDPDLAALDRSGWLRYVLQPIADGFLQDTVAEMLLGLAASLAPAPQAPAGERSAVLTHCNAGRNRSGLFNALMLRHTTGMTGFEALRTVRGARPGAIANASFEAFLLNLDPRPPAARKVVIVQAGAGGAGKSTTTRAFARGEPQERRAMLPCEMGRNEIRTEEQQVIWTVYDNCAVAGNHNSGSDANTGPGIIAAALDQCLEERDVAIVDGMQSSPRWVQMCNNWQADHEETELRVIVLHYDLSPEEVLGRLAGRRGEAVAAIRDHFLGKCQATCGRATSLVRYFHEQAQTPVRFEVATAPDDTASIVARLNKAADEELGRPVRKHVPGYTPGLVGQAPAFVGLQRPQLELL